MASEFLPPVVIPILVQDKEAIAELDSLQAKLDETAASASASADEIEASSERSGASMAGMADGAALGAAGTKGAMDDTSEAADGTAADVHDASSSMAGDLEGVGVGAAAGRQGVEDAAAGTSSAAEDMASGVGASSAKVVASTSKASAMVQKLGKGVALGMLGVLAGATDVAIKLEATEARLATSIKNTGGGTLAQHKASIEGVEGAMVKYGKTPGETVEALSTLTTASKSLSAGEKDMGLAADYAARKHMSLAAAASMLAKIYSGTPGRAIKEFGINLPGGSGKLATLESGEKAVTAAKAAKRIVEQEVTEGKLTGAMATLKEAGAAEKLSIAEEKLLKDKQAIPLVFKEMENVLHGEAAKQAGTLSGQLAVVKAEGDEAAGALGKNLVPVLKDAAVDLGSFIGWLVKGSAPAKAVMVAVGGIGTALAGLYVASKLKAGAVIAKELAMMAAKMLGIGGAATESAAVVTGADGEIVVANEAAGVSFMGMLAPIALVAAALAGIVGVATAVTKILGKGSFIENVKELLSGDKGVHQAEASRERGGQGELTAMEGLAASLAKRHKNVYAGVKAAIAGYNQTTFEVVKEMKEAGKSIPDMAKYASTRQSAIRSFELKKLGVGGLITGPTIAELGESGPEVVIPLKGGVGAMNRAVQPLSGSSTNNIEKSGGLHVNAVNVYGAQVPTSQLVNDLYLKLRPLLQGV
jgi:hypothetical protein